VGDVNSKRISHEVENLPTVFRKDNLQQIINDLAEEDIGIGFTELIKTGIITDKIISWLNSSKTQKRSETTLTRTGAFVSSFKKEIFDEETGITKIATINGTVNRSGNNDVISVDVSVTRP